MKAIFTYLTGGRAGQAVVVEKSYAMLGRAPQADVRFGPDHDLPVSGRHAAVVLRDGDWILRDLASTNGTFVNGVRITGEHQLGDQDLIRLGDGGPMLRFGVLQDTWRPSTGAGAVPAPPVTEPDVAVVTTAVPKTPLSTATATETDKRFVVSVTATRHRAPWMAALLVLLVLGSLGGLAIWRARASKGAVDERAVLLAQADSLFATLEAIGHGDARISGALDGAKAETARLRSRIRRAPRDREVLAPLRDSLDRLSSSFERLAAAAALDAQQIARTNEASLAVVEATYEDGSRRVAAAFTARRAAGAVVFVTVQDIMQDSAGHPPASLTVQPSGAPKPLRTRALAAHSALNVAILEVPKGSNAGAPPTLATSAGSGLVGQAAVLVGYPSARLDAGATPTQATALAAVTIATDKLLQLEPLGTTLAPGSPVFDRSGTVIGMLLATATSAHLLDAVPAPAISAFLSGTTGDR